MDKIWEKVTTLLQERLGQVSFETWIAPLQFVGLKEGRTATVKAPNTFFRDWVHERYNRDIEQCLSAAAGKQVEVDLIAPVENGKSKEAVAGTVHPTSPQPPASESATPGITGCNKLDPRYRFDNFVVGPSNQLAHAAACAVAKQPGEEHNPLFLYGSVGLGKTHLATALGHKLSADPERNVVFVPAELLLNELISSLRHDRTEQFREKMGRVDVLILDDVHFLAGRERTQEEFLDIFDALHKEGHQIILTSDKHPRGLNGLDEDLRKRFESGLIVNIAPPDFKTRIAILQMKAAEENFVLPAEVALYVAEKASSNVRELQGCLKRLSAFSSMANRPVTLDLARQSLSDLIRNEQPPLDISTIQRHVAAVLHIPLPELMSQKRTQRLAFCRQLAMYLCRELTASSFPIIGAAFGRDHSTVIHAYNLIGRRVKSDAAFRTLVQNIETKLKVQSAAQDRDTQSSPTESFKADALGA